MRRHLPLALSLFAGLLVWAVVTWPLPARFASVIPLSERRAEDAPRLVFNHPGDQFQLLYHFWLARDVIAGGTPPFANVYEFNYRGDAARHEFSTYYVPFSLIYAAISPLFGHAAGWNAVILSSFIIGLLGAFFLANRLSESDWIAAFVTILTAAFPYRWHTLLTGSPTGYAICLVPWLAYGIDRLVRDASSSGSAIAGATLLFAFCSDLHVFYFSVLATPLFAMMSLLLAWRSGVHVLRICRAGLIFGASVAAVAVLSRITSSAIGASTIRHGRTFEEIGLFSPAMRGLFSTQFLAGTTNTLYIGFFAGMFFPLALVRFLATPGCRRDRGRMVAVFFLSCVAIATILLAAGANGPFMGLPVRVVRLLVPKYDLIRQPAKILCLMPTILAAFAALSMADIAKSRKPRSMTAIVLALGVATFLQQANWFRVPLNMIAFEAPAYRAARAAAAAAGTANPKAVVIPIWPGDSHYASLYELGVMESRLRLVNGYSPSPPADYFDEVFKPLESLNQGKLDAAQARLLKRMGVDFLIFHEDAFPDKVSPFPAGVSLDALRANPALEQIFQEGRVAAFRLKDGGAEAVDRVPHAEATRPRTAFDYATALVWGERQVARSLETASAPGRINLALRAPVVMRPGMRYMVLDRATGWHSIPLDNPMGGEYPLPDGVADPALIILSAGDDGIGDGEITPARMFHNGTSLADGTVILDTGAVPDRHCAIEGPFAPLPAGRWRITVKAVGACDNGASLEVASGVRGDAVTLASTPFSPLPDGGGDAASIDFRWSACDPPFAFRAMADQVAPLEIRSIRLERLED